jgi:MFS transporter, DHA1 family, multidrug resistance protein
LTGAAADRLPRRTLISCGLATCGIAVAVIASATTYATVATGLGVYAVGAVVTHAASTAYITDLVSSARYGAAHGTFGTIYDVGDASGPLVGGLLVSVWGYAVMFRAVGTVAVVAAVVFFLASRKSHPVRRSQRTDHA